MSALSIQPTFPIFTETDGLPLENGYIWIGTANLDPQGNPINVYWDAALTIPAAQPIRTLNGYPSRSGTPARLYVSSNYSIRVQNSKGSLVYSAPVATESYGGGIINATDVAYNNETVATALDRAGEANPNAWGNIKQNTSDYATLGANLLPAFGSLTKVNFDGSGNHVAGTVGTMTGSVTGSPFSYYLLKMVITTTTPGEIALLISGSTIFGDLPAYYFSNAAVLNDGGENNQFVTTNQYYFYIPTSTSGFTNFSIQTDTSFAGQVSALEMYEVDQTKFAVGGCGSEVNGPENPVGLKVGAFNRNDTAIGNIYTLGLMSYDGVAPIAAQNVAMGSYALASNFKGDENTAYGTLALAYNEGSNNTAVGYSALKFNTKGQENTAVGYKAASLNTTGFRNTFMGMWSGAYNRTGNYNTRVGWSPIIAGGISSGDTSMGAPAGTAVLTGGANCFYGSGSGVTTAGQATLNLTGVAAMGYNTKPWGNYSTAIGFGAVVGAEGAFADNAVAIGYNATAEISDTTAIGAGSSAEATNCTAIGFGASATAVNGTAVGDSASAFDSGTALGYNAQATGLANAVAVGRDSVATGEQAVVIGPQAEGVAYRNTVVGSQAGLDFNGQKNSFFGAISGVQAVAYENCTLLGYGTAVTGSNQVQLGDAATTTYAYGAVQNRSDSRDKADVRPTALGLDFINSLRPVDFKWDMRQDYFDLVEEEVEVSVVEKQFINTGAVDQAGLPVFEEREVTVVRKQPSTKRVPVEKDGSRKRNRFHHGLIAQEVKAACDAAGVDFGGYQDHSINGGDDVLSIGYEELIAPLIKAVQQLSAEVAELKSKIS